MWKMATEMGVIVRKKVREAHRDNHACARKHQLKHTTSPWRAVGSCNTPPHLPSAAALELHSGVARAIWQLTRTYESECACAVTVAAAPTACVAAMCAIACATRCA